MMQWKFGYFLQKFIKLDEIYTIKLKLAKFKFENIINYTLKQEI
jgi:hypothetical protein